MARSTMPPTHALFYAPGRNWLAGKSIKEQPLRDHGQYLAKLAQEGILIFAGPWRNENGTMVLIRVKSDSDAQEVMEQDPAVRDGVLISEAKAWEVLYQGTGHPMRIKQ
ncbi:MAG: YciI family protein [Armatimonadetes bacterium]|nr:YciI family protein [Armatimonadota bacterium]